MWFPPTLENASTQASLTMNNQFDGVGWFPLVAEPLPSPRCGAPPSTGSVCLSSAVRRTGSVNGLSSSLGWRSGSIWAREMASGTPCEEDGGSPCEPEEQADAEEGCRVSEGAGAKSCCRFPDGTSSVRCKSPLLGFTGAPLYVES